MNCIMSQYVHQILQIYRDAGVDINHIVGIEIEQDEALQYKRVHGFPQPVEDFTVVENTMGQQGNVGKDTLVAKIYCNASRNVGSLLGKQYRHVKAIEKSLEQVSGVNWRIQISPYGADDLLSMEKVRTDCSQLEGSLDQIRQGTLPTKWEGMSEDGINQAVSQLSEELEKLKAKEKELNREYDARFGEFSAIKQSILGSL